jgi:hypothetical protein
MNFNLLKLQLSQQSDVILSLVTGVSPEAARWRPDEKSWSLLEVINHLYDEEREDFRAHLEQVLSQGERAWQRIDPPRWVIERQYNQRDWQASIDAFLSERRQSLDWLATLSEPDWTQSMPSPWGSISAGSLAASWAAHDWLHIRQLVELRRALLVEQVLPYPVEYAGEW